MQTIGFDPSISMKHKNGGRAIEIPVWFAEKLVALINDKNIPSRQQSQRAKIRQTLALDEHT
jgi:hypothetical protein